MLTMSQSMSAAGPAPVARQRLPEMQVRSHRDGKPAIPKTPSSSGTDQSPTPRSPVDRFSPRRPVNNRSKSSQSSSRPPSRCDEGHLFTGIPTQDKNDKSRSSLLGRLTLREPSHSALKEFKAEQRKLAAVKESKTLYTTGISQQKLPHDVPKVNSKWDGLPKVAHDKQRQSLAKDRKRSADSASGSARGRKASAGGSKSSVSTGPSSGSTKRRSTDHSMPTDAAHGSITPAASTETKTAQPQTLAKTPKPIIALEPAHTPPVPDLTPVRNESPETCIQIQPRFSTPDLPRIPDPSSLSVLSVLQVHEARQLLPEPSSEPATADVPFSPEDVLQDTSHDNQILPLAATQVVHFNSTDEIPQWPLPTNPRDVVIKKLDLVAPSVPVNPPDSTKLLPNLPAVAAVNKSTKVMLPKGVTRLTGKPHSTHESDNPEPSPDFDFFSQSTSSLPSGPIRAARARPGYETYDVRTPPRFLPGRPVTKDSDLDTIPESDTASVHLRIPTTGTQLSSRPSQEFDGMSIISRASSELSAQWHQSPKERLGLGGFIKHSQKDNPWPLPPLEDEQYVLDGSFDRSHTPTQADRDRRNKRVSIINVFKR